MSELLFEAAEISMMSIKNWHNRSNLEPETRSPDVKELSEGKVGTKSYGSSGIKHDEIAAN